MTKPQNENTPSAASETSAQGVRAMQSERRRADILKASKEVLAQGYADFSLRKVASAAGVRLATVQHHFGDLESLILAMITSSTEEFMRYSRQLAEGQYESPEDDLKVFLDDAWTFVRDVNVRNLYFEVWAMGRHRPVVADWLKQIYEEYIQALAPILRRINPKLTEAEARTTATLISCLTEGAIVMAHWSNQDAASLGLLGVRLKAACLALAETANGSSGKRT
jgi:AcrR family transcriptional regulator